MSSESFLAERLWPRLAIFAGNATPEAIAAICKDLGRSPEIIAALNVLLRQGRVVTAHEGESATYHVSETLRAKALAQLAASGEADQLYTRLVDYTQEVAEQSLEGAFGPERASWIQRLVQEYPGFSVALDWLAARGDAERALLLAFLLQELWFEEEYTSAGRQWFARLLALPLANTRTTQHAQVLDLAGALALGQGDYVEAGRLKQEGITILRELDNPIRLGFALLHLGNLSYAQGDFVAAHSHFQDGCDLLRANGHEEGTAHALADLANVAIHMGDYSAAQPLMIESFRLYQQLDFLPGMASSLQRAAGIATGKGQYERALRLAGASAALRAVVDVSLPQIYKERYESMIAKARQALDASTQAALWAEGQAMSLEEALTEALHENT